MVRVLIERGVHAWVTEGHRRAPVLRRVARGEVEVVLDQR
jgi:hypothetical protein